MKVMHQRSNKALCCQQQNYNDLVIKTGLATKLQFKIGLPKSRTMC